MAADVATSGRSNAAELTKNTVIVVLGASGDLAKKKVRCVASQGAQLSLSPRPDTLQQAC